MFRPFNVIAIVYAAKIRPLSEFHPTSPFSKTEAGEGHDDTITDDVRYEQKLSVWIMGVLINNLCGKI